MRQLDPRSPILPLLVVLLLLAPSCKKQEEGGKPLWEKACRHLLKVMESKEKPGMLTKCMDRFAVWDKGEADRFARCVLTRTSEAGFEQCPPPSALKRQLEDTRAIARNRLKLTSLKMLIESHRARTGRIPSTLEEVLPKAAARKDAWGRSYIYKPVKGSSRRFSLCSAGSDGKSGTMDDQCVSESLLKTGGK